MEQRSPTRSVNERPPHEGLTTYHWSALLVLLVVFAYGPAFVCGFIWDDDDYVVNNYNLRTAQGLVRTWLEPRSIPQYYPLVHTSYWLEYQLWDLWPAGYHATNIFLHVASAVLLWRLLLLLELPGAWMAAAIFAVHPVHVESVAWITERKNTLSLLFYLASAYCFLRRELVPQFRGNWKLYMAALGCFLAALLCKTVAATLPCALLVVLWWKQGALSLRQVALAAPMILMAVPLGLHTAWLERHHVGAIGPDWEFSLTQRFLIAGRAVWFYAAKLVAPYPLAFMYPKWGLDARDWRQYVFPVAAGGLVAGLFLLRNRIGRGPLAATLYFGGTLVPALGFFNVYPMKYSFVADHFQYAASLGPIVLFVSGAAWITARRRWRVIAQLAACLLLAALASLTWRQCLIYQDQETLWRDTLAKSPQCEMAYINYGHWLQAEKRLPEALEVFQRAVQLRPRHPDGHIGQAMTYAALSKLDRAEQILQAAIELDPSYALTYGNLAYVMFQKGSPDEAERYFKRAMELEEDNILFRFNYGNLLFKERRFEEAQAEYERVIEQSPVSPSARFNLAVVHLERGNQGAAVDQLRAALRIDPEYADAKELLEQILAGEESTTPQSTPIR